MHLAVAARLLPDLPPDMDASRFLTGSLLVDAAPAHQRDATHFIVRDGALRTYDLPRFRAQVGAHLTTDGLVLGYYLHLVQDLMFRRFMYHMLHIDPSVPGYLAALYVDYGRLNHLLPGVLGLPVTWDFPQTAHPLDGIADFDLAGMQAALAQDLACNGLGVSTYLTPERAEEYFTLATALCRKELRALREGLPLLNPRDGFTWERDPRPKE